MLNNYQYNLKLSRSIVPILDRQCDEKNCRSKFVSVDQHELEGKSITSLFPYMIFEFLTWSHFPIPFVDGGHFGQHSQPPKANLGPFGRDEEEPQGLP